MTTWWWPRSRGEKMLVNIVLEGITGVKCLCSVCGSWFFVDRGWMREIEARSRCRGVFLPVCGYCWHRQKGFPSVSLGAPAPIPFTKHLLDGGVIFYRTEAL